MSGTAGRTPRWTARLAVALVLVLGCFVFWSAVETGHGWLYGMAATGILGAMSFAIGVERPNTASGPAIRVVGWLMMLGFTLVPTNLLFLPAVVVISTAPSAFGWGIGPRPAPAPPSR